MKRSYYKILSITFVFFVTGILSLQTVSAQLTGWKYFNTLEVINRSSGSKTNYQELIVVNTQSLVSAGKMKADGSDIRFTDSCSANANILSHYVISGMNTDSTKIWVKLPSLPNGGFRTIYLVYGNASASSVSSQSNTFPSSWSSSGNTVLSGTNNYSWFEVRAGDTVFSSAGSPLLIKARHMLINGVICGNARGNVITSTSSNGVGTGAGTTSSNQTAGSGGGGYGGSGGNGGYDAGDSVGRGGIAYGTAGGSDVAMGSSGASSDLVLGGNGGGSITLSAEYIDIGGTICADGGNGAGLQARNGGGGSGGSIMCQSRYANYGGLISATGGKGGVGTSTANDDGGGGGGGRVKLFYWGSAKITASITVAGGKGGPNGTAATGQNGSDGSIYSGKMYFNADSAVNKSLYIRMSDADGTICDGNPLTVTANIGYSEYRFYLNGSSVQTGTSNKYNFTTLKTGDSIEVQASNCGVSANKVGYKIKAVIAKPKVGISALDSSLCTGDSTLLTAKGAVTYSWIGGPKTLTYKIKPSATKTWMIIGTDANGCFDTGRLQVTVSEYPALATISGNDHFCSGTATVLKASGASQFRWMNGSTADSLVVAPKTDTSIYAWAYDDPACQVKVEISLSVFPLPDVYISGKTHACPGETLSLGANGATFYSWFDGSTSNSHSLKPTGSSTIWLAGKDDNGCRDTGYKNITVDTLPKIHISGDLDICTGESSSLTASGASTYKWMNGSTKTSISLSPASDLPVWVAGTDGNNCKDSAKAVLKVHALPVVTLNFSSSGLDTICLLEPPQTLSGGLPAGGSYSGPGISAQKFNPANTGTGQFLIQYIYTDAIGCSDSASKSIVVDNCAGTSQVLTALFYKIYPNPSDGTVYIYCEQEGEWVVYNQTGGVVAKAFVVAGQVANLSVQHLPAGMYHLTGIFRQGKTVSSKLLVVH